MPLRAQPFERCHRAEGRTPLGGRFDVERLQLDCDERRQLDRRVVGTKWKFERNCWADRRGQHRRIACRSRERRRPELHGGSRRCACAAPCSHTIADAGASANADSGSNAGARTNAHARPGTTAARSARRVLRSRNRRQRTMSEPHVHRVGTNGRDRQLDEFQRPLVRRRGERRPGRERKRTDRQQRRDSRRRRGESERR